MGGKNSGDYLTTIAYLNVSSLSDVGSLEWQTDSLALSEGRDTGWATTHFDAQPLQLRPMLTNQVARREQISSQETCVFAPKPQRCQNRRLGST